ncbi:MAG: response regulator transcription factor [Cyanobacteria bacterium]|nr:response regulator transcription factor [Cyanobacteriota bacterium]
MSKILIVEDEKDLAMELKDWFDREMYITEVVHSGVAACELLTVYQYDVILLDWMMPEMDGLEVCRRYRSQGGKAPIIMLTARNSSADAEEGLDCGADYYIKKPVSLRELSASVRAAIRRASKAPESTILEVGHLRLDVTSHTVMKDGGHVHLEPREYYLLAFLMRNPGQVFSAEALISRVWPSDTLVSADSVRTYIKGLRRKLDVEGNESIIKNVRGVGYKLEVND